MSRWDGARDGGGCNTRENKKTNTRTYSTAGTSSHTRNDPCNTPQAMTADFKAAKQASAKLEVERAKNAHSSARLATRVYELEVQLADTHGKLDAAARAKDSFQLPVDIDKLHLHLLHTGSQRSTGVGILGAFCLQFGRCLLSCFEVGRHRLYGKARSLSGDGRSSRRTCTRVCFLFSRVLHPPPSRPPCPVPPRHLILVYFILSQPQPLRRRALSRPCLLPCAATPAMAADLKEAKQAKAKLEAKRAKSAHSSAPWATRVQGTEVQLADVHGKLNAAVKAKDSFRLPVDIGKLHLQLVHTGSQPGTGVGILGAFDLQFGISLLGFLEVGRHRLCGEARVETGARQGASS